MNASTPAHDSPPWPVLVWRATITAVWLGVVLLVLAGLLPGFTIDRWPDALLAGIVVGLLNAVIFVSARKTGEDVHRGLSAVAADYFTKPVDIDPLAARIRELLAAS